MDEPKPRSKSKLVTWIFAVCVAAGLGITIPRIFVSGGGPYPRRVPISHLGELAFATLQYCDDNQGYFPTRNGWNLQVLPYTKSKAVLLDTMLPRSGDQRGLGLNPEICNTSISNIEDSKRVVMFGQTLKPGKDALVTLETVRYEKTITILASCNGSVETFSPERAAALQWSPTLSR